MKRFILIVLLFIMFLPFYVNAKTCDTDKISISSITTEETIGGAEEISAATASGKKINLNLSMSEVGDNIEYKIVVKNDSNEDYELDKKSLNLNSDYFNYSLESNDNSNVIKANSTKNIKLIVKYKNEVPENKFENGSYSNNKTMTIKLYNGNTIEIQDTLKNPNTGVQSYIFICVILLIVSEFLYIVLKKKKNSKIMILIIGCSVIIPISVYALCESEIKIESNIKIVKNNKCKTFEEDDWKTIKLNINNNCYHVGDTKEIDMGEFGTHTLRIANMSIPNECNIEGFSQTACGFVLEFTDIITTYDIYPEDWHERGWPVSQARIYLNNDVFNSLPNDLKNIIIDTTTVSSHSSLDTLNYITIDKLYLLSPHEIWNDEVYCDAAWDFTNQLDYYRIALVSNPNGAKKLYNGATCYWWLRSSNNCYPYSFHYVTYNGHSYDPDGFFGDNGISPAFRIG